jgi:hypothetical protein
VASPLCAQPTNVAQLQLHPTSPECKAKLAAGRGGLGWWPGGNRACAGAVTNVVLTDGRTADLAGSDVGAGTWLGEVVERGGEGGKVTTSVPFGVRLIALEAA